MAADDFDRSFDFFAEIEHDPWKSFDTNVDSHFFAFSPTTVNDDEATEQGAAFCLFEDDVFHEKSIPIAMHEEVSAMYDDYSPSQGGISVRGSIYVKSIQRHKSRLEKKFQLLWKGNVQNIQRIEPVSDLCQIEEDGRISVQLKPDQSEDELVLANYFCISELRPVPLLVKSRVSAVDTNVRLGFKVRANPSNEIPLKSIVILLAVPPDVNGADCKMSRKGSWEELKRTLCWRVEQLVPGQALEIQAQFSLLEASDKEPKFPVLVRCDYPSIFSDVELSTDEESHVKANVTKSTRILHRKV